MLIAALGWAALATAAATLTAIVPGPLRARLLPGLGAGLLCLAAAGFAARELGIATAVAAWGSAVVVVVTAIVPIWWGGWSWLARQVMASATGASLLYLAFSIQQTVVQAITPTLHTGILIGSLLLILGETASMALALSYLFEILDVLSRPRPGRAEPPPETPGQPLPMVVVQVPMYNEPVEIVRETLLGLAGLDYPNFMVQAVDNNTADPAVWEPVQRICADLGERFQFIHLDDWPGFKAGALNEATRRLPPAVELLAIVDADYLVSPGFLRDVVPYFNDPEVGFVQTPQNYREWRDDPYLRGLFHSYRYFFDVTMPSRAHRQAIIFCGTMGVLRRSVLREIGGWSESCITEDAEASLRILGRGYHGIYRPVAWGEGLMPLTFDGLKKQRFRWALGGLQILRQHWRELVPLVPHRLELSIAQRWSYLLGALQWFGDGLLAIFTLLLIATAVSTADHHRLPIREITGAVLVVPFLFMLLGLLRAAWAMRRTDRLSWPDAVRAVRIWFALSWTVALANLRGLLTSRARFLRTPKRREGESGWRLALRSARMEATVGVLAVAAAAGMLVRAPSLTTAILAIMLTTQAAVYLSAPWAGLAAEGIHLTPTRRIYLRSAQSTGERAERSGSFAALPVGLALGALSVLVLAFTLGSPQSTSPFGGGGVSPAPPPSSPPSSPAVPSASPPASPSTSPSPRPSPSVSPSVRPSPSPSPSPSATASPSPSSSPSVTPSPT